VEVPVQAIEVEQVMVVKVVEMVGWVVCAPVREEARKVRRECCYPFEREGCSQLWLHPRWRVLSAAEACLHNHPP
jgi:hypothetical protein